ncbi:MAG: hypothetical protein K9H64_04870 [Bacteroidales bacterium]|nr:hypothetical protein [Bacteroidales bacterium]MCF8455169.1 hypothetical protein [Bacteroidales bacterium]
MFTLVCGIGLFAQNSDFDFIEAYFVKNDFVQDPDEFYVNILRIRNNSGTAIKISPKLILPNQWQLISTLTTYLIQPQSTKAIPIRANVSKLSLANIDYEIEAQLSDSNNLIVGVVKSRFQILAKSDWTVSAYNNMKFIQSDSSIVSALFKITNNGNVQEELKVKFEIGKELKIVQVDSILIDTSMVLTAMAEKEIQILVTYDKKFKNQNFSSTLKIFISSASREQTVNFSFVRLNTEYDNYTRDQHTPNFIQLTAMSPQSDLARYRLLTKGAIKTDKDRTINYSFSNNDLSNGKNFKEQSQYNLNYQTKSFEGGIGTGSSNLGRDISYQESFYAKYNYVYDSLYTLSGFASVSPFDGETRLGFGHFYKDEKYTIGSSLGASIGTKSKIDNISIKEEGEFLLRHNQRFNYRISGVWEENYSKKQYQEQGYSHIFSYVLPITKQLRVWASHRLGSSNFPGSERGSQNFASNLNYVFLKSLYSLHASWNNILLNPTLYNENRERLPENNVKKDVYVLRLTSPSASFVGYGIGSSITVLESELETDQNTVQSGTIKMYNLLLDGRITRRYLNYQSNLSLGYIDDNNAPKRPNIKIKTSATNSNYGVEIEYQDGIESGNFSVKQRIEQKLSMRPYYKKSLLRNNLTVTANAQYNYNFLIDKGKISFIAGVDGLLRNNWKIHFASRIDCQLVKSYTLSGSKLANLELGISKGISFSRSEIEYYDVSIKFFKDENGNGIQDNDESGIGNMMAGITKTGALPGKENATNGGHRSDNFKYIPLASDKKGEIKMEYMPEGLYNINITAFQNLSGYFNFTGTQQSFQLDANQTVYIPYEKAGKIFGQLIIKRDAYSSMGLVSPENIRIIATSAEGKEYSSLTGRNGNYILYVPQNSNYTIRIVNPFGAKMEVLKNNIVVDLNHEPTIRLNFIFKEKGRKINFNKNN